MNRAIIFISLASCLGVIQPAYGDFTCRSDVSYSWKKEKEEHPSDVFSSTIQASGVTEDAAKAALADMGAREQGKAMVDCRKEHENRSGCIAAKYAANGSVIQLMKGEARKALEDAIVSDCAVAQGGCIKATIGEPKCSENVSAEATPTPAAGKEAKAGAAKKK